MSSYAQLIEAAREGALLLTANERLFRYLRQRYDQAQQQAGLQVWNTPQIISYQGWLSQCLNLLGESWRLLEKQQALRLWEQLIEQSCRGTELELLQLGATAEKAYAAFQLLREYRVTLEGEYLTDDQQVFQGWLQRFEQTCRRQQWLDRSELPDYLCRAAEAGRLQLPEQILLVGFDQLPAGAEQLLETCKKLGKACQAVALQSAQPAEVAIYPAEDETDEILQAARWARRLLDQGFESVGVVVFGLQGKRARLERLFRDQLAPDASPGLHDDEGSFTLSLGAPLLEQGVVYAACELLGCGQQLPLEKIAFLLRTPYLGGSQSEADSRAQLDRRLRSFRQPNIKLTRLERLLDEDEQLASLRSICQQLQRFADEQQKQLPGAWAEIFAGQLERLGWPGERSLSSSEYQALKAWREKLLPGLAALDPVSEPLSRSDALGLLRRLAGDLSFQLEAPTGPLQLVGQLEAAGLQFEQLWVMGLTENALPAAARPNPFLPYALQRDCGMPHADAARELQFAEQLIQRLLQASPRVVFSYPRREGDAALRPSPLLPAATAGTPIAFADPQDALSRLQQARPELERLSDTQGPPLASEAASGGTGILKDQAHCPFRAFVHHRLRGNALEQAAPGLDAMTRGNLVHRVLERFWQQLGEQQALLEMDETELAQLLQALADEEVEAYFAERSRPSTELLQLEKQRLPLLIADWLNSVERKRQPFKVVQLEQERVEQLGPLQIKTRIDRVDELTDGSRIVIDYKTGSSQKAEDLLSEPLLEPQLPIYAVAADAEADGVAFAQLLRSKCRLFGVVRENGLLGRVKTLTDYPQAGERKLEEWNDLLQDWRRQLEQLASDFVAGKALVQPADLQRSCRYCDLPGLCRIDSVTDEEGGEL